jgi:arabinofuranan 3-O-arabinosyltransferase
VETLGVGVSELGIAGLDVGDGAAVVDVPCGQGPVVTVDGAPRQTSLRTTVAALRSLQPVDLGLCGADATTGPLAPGPHRFAALSSDTFAVRSATLLRTGVTGAAPADGRQAADVGRWGREHRTVRVGGRTEPTLLVVPESVNPGWVATLDGRELRTQTVDGWQQGYVLPAGRAGEVVLDFRPGAVYHAALVAGAVAVLVLFLLLLLPARGAVPPAAGRDRRARAAVALAVVAAIALIGGGWGLLALAGTTVLGRVVRRRWVLGALAATSLVTAGGAFLTMSGDGVRVAVQVLALAAVAAVAGSVLLEMCAGTSGTTSRQRRIGRSTST